MLSPTQNSIPAFRAIPIASLLADTIADFDIYVRMQDVPDPVLFRNRDLSITSEVIKRLQDNRHERILIPASQEHEYAKYVARHLETMVGDKSVPVRERSKVLYSSAQAMMQDLFSSPESPELKGQSTTIVSAAANLLVNESGAFEQLVGLVSHDYYTYTHSVNVFMYSFTLAHRAGIGDKSTLQEFGEGALLHDIGKSKIDPSVIRCPGKLDENQWKQMKMHPVLGHDILSDHMAFSEIALDVTRHHHEKMRGGGYPDGLDANRLSPYVRISTIADIFDALTTKRPYKDSMSTFKALQIMQNEMSQDLDPALFRLFVEIMGRPGG